MSSFVIITCHIVKSSVPNLVLILTCYVLITRITSHLSRLSLSGIICCSQMRELRLWELCQGQLTRLYTVSVTIDELPISLKFNTLKHQSFNFFTILQVRDLLDLWIPLYTVSEGCRVAPSVQDHHWDLSSVWKGENS